MQCAGTFCAFSDTMGDWSYQYNTFGKLTQQTDANGNQTQGNGRTIEWTAFNKAHTITDSSGETHLSYGANHERATQTTYYVGSGYEYITDTADHSEKYRINLHAGNTLIGTYIKTLTGGNRELDRLRYLHTDALGNVDMISDIDGNVVAAQHYSPFGQREQHKNTTLQAKQTTNFIQSNHQMHLVDQSILNIS